MPNLAASLSHPLWLKPHRRLFAKGSRLFPQAASLLQDLLARTMTNSHVGGGLVLIGGEGTWEELKQCSVVLARYGIPGIATGTLGVFGPMRMPYARNIPTVRFMADLLSSLVSETMVGEDNEQ